MKRGRKAEPAATHAVKGTYQPSRHAAQVQIAADASIIGPGTLPVQSDGLTEAGKQIWLDDIGRVSTTRSATELDSTQFKNYCNLQGAIDVAWISGAAPPAAYLTEARRLAELFGIAGVKSRVFKPGVEKAAANAFMKHGKRG